MTTFLGRFTNYVKSFFEDPPGPVKNAPVFYALVATPLILNFVTFAIFGSPDITPGPELENVIPPGWVFSVVWTVNYICLGAAWAYSGNNPVTHMIVLPLVALLMAWTPVYTGGDELAAFYIIMTCIFLSALFYTFGNRRSKLLMVPLLAWLLTASKFNFRVV